MKRKKVSLRDNNRWMFGRSVYGKRKAEPYRLTVGCEKTTWRVERHMFLQKALRASLALVLACGLASFSRAIVTTARSETAQETAICVGTSLDPPDDICGWADAHALQGSTCRVKPRSV